MRIVHTSDWHLGRTLHGVDLLDAQAAYLDHLVALVREESVDLVVVAGDVYDRAVPPVEAVALLADALARLAETAEVVLTPGNHDSAVRLGFGARLMRPSLHLRATVGDVGVPVVLEDEHGPVLVHALPYLDPDSVRHALATGHAAGEVVPLPRSHEAVMSAAMGRVRGDLAARAGSGRRPRALVMAHAFVLGGQGSDSERDIRVGGVDSVPAGVFDGVDYVALGHLHGAQRLAAGPGPGPAPVLQYSGSPLAYSFSERNHRKVSVLLTLGPEGVDGEPELVPAPVPRRLTQLEGRLEEVLARSEHRADWVKAVITDAARPADLVPRVHAAFPHALVVEHHPAARESVRLAAVTASHDPLEVTAEFVEHVTGAPPDEAERAVLRRAYESVQADGRSD
ncbi:exonuclease SbcCD subunit D [Actinotalea sp.]|uniref:exonuclease SbcCD subunit D n=1 Tax=Actinotalea sp. TaxID=1872145 RepID=UPI003567FB3E